MQRILLTAAVLLYASPTCAEVPTTGSVHLLCKAPGETNDVTDRTSNNSPRHEYREHAMTSTLWIDYGAKTLLGSPTFNAPSAFEVRNNGDTLVAHMEVEGNGARGFVEVTVNRLTGGVDELASVECYPNRPKSECESVTTVHWQCEVAPEPKF
jgi:hypothetical protein